MSLPISAQIEAILFFKNEPATIDTLASYLEVPRDMVEEELNKLKEMLSSRGIILIRNGEEVALGTHPDTHSLIETLTKEELTRDLGKAGLETLAIILYKGLASKKEVDYIRGVNSGFILRNLLIRGLIKKEDHSEDRSFAYTPTTELLAYLGVGTTDELPEYESIIQELEGFVKKETTSGAENI